MNLVLINLYIISEYYTRINIWLVDYGLFFFFYLLIIYLLMTAYSLLFCLHIIILCTLDIPIHNSFNLLDSILSNIDSLIIQLIYSCNINAYLLLVDIYLLLASLRNPFYSLPSLLIILIGFIACNYWCVYIYAFFNICH